MPITLDKNKPFVIVGAGGHCNVIVDILALRSIQPTHYIDDVDKPQLNNLGVARVTADTFPAGAQGTISFGGVTVGMLGKRLSLQNTLIAKGMAFPPLIHPSAIISKGAKIHDGAHICAGTIINAGAHIGAGSIINSGTIIEHDVAIGEGCHIAPGAIVLGDAVIGSETFIGSGAVIIQGTRVPSHTFIPAMSRYNSSTS